MIFLDGVWVIAILSLNLPTCDAFHGRRQLLPGNTAMSPPRACPPSVR